MGISPRPRAIIVMTAALLLIGPLVPLSGLMDAALNPVPVLNLSLTPNQLQATVTDTQNGAVMFGGNATVEKLSTSLLRVTVTLSASCIWPALISPSTMVFTESNRPQPFAVTVVVPPKTSSLEVGTLIVSGTAKAPGVSIVTASANAVVTVRQYFSIEGSVLGGPFEGVHAGGTVEGHLRVNNTGNGLDSVTIDLLDPDGTVSTRDMIRSVDIKQGESKDVPFTLHINGSLGALKDQSREIGFVCTSTEAHNQGLDLSVTAWCTLSFGTKPAGPTEAAPSGGGEDGGSLEPIDDPAGIPLALVVLVALIVVLSVIIAHLGRKGEGREGPAVAEGRGGPGP